MAIGLTDILVALGNFPLLEDISLKGGYRVVADVAARDAIDPSLQKSGMLVWCEAEQELYRLSGGWALIPLEPGSGTVNSVPVWLAGGSTLQDSSGSTGTVILGSGSGQDVNIQPGASGAANIVGGAAVGINQSGGPITLEAGAPTGSGSPGEIYLQAANGATLGGSLYLKPGGGADAPSDGSIVIGPTGVLNRAARLQFTGDDGNAVSLKAPTTVTSYGLVLPDAQGGASTVLTNDGAGNLSWGAGSGAGSGTASTVSVWATGGTTLEDSTASSGTVVLGSGAGQSITVQPTAASVLNADGGSITLTSGAPNGTGNPGQINLVCVDNPTGFGTSVSVTGGAGSTPDLDGGLVLIPNNIAGRATPLVFVSGDNGYVAVQAPASISVDYTLKLPSAQGAAGTALTNDGSGNLSWVAGGGGGYGEAQINATVICADSNPTTIHTFVDGLVENRSTICYDVLLTAIGPFGGAYASFKISAVLERDTTGGTIVERQVVFLNGPIRSNPAWNVQFSITNPDTINLQVVSAFSVKWRAVGFITQVSETFAEA